MNVWISEKGGATATSLQLSILHPSCRRVCGGGRRFINRFDLITRLRRRGSVYGVYLLIERLVEGLAVIGIVTAQSIAPLSSVRFPEA